MKKIFLSLALGMVIVNVYSQTILKFAPNAGTRINQHLVADIEMSMKGDDMATKMNTYGHIDIIKVENGITTLKATTDSLIMVVAGPDGEQVINSSDPEANSNPQLAPLLEIIGKEIELRVDQSGKIVSDNAAEAPELAKLSIIEFVKPDKNNSWAAETEATFSGIKMKVKSRFKIGKITKDEVAINGTATLNFMGKKIEAPTTYILDAKTGVVKSNVTVMDMSMMGMKMKTTTSYSTKITSI